MKILLTVILILFSTNLYAESCENSVIPKIKADKSNGELITYLASLKSTVLFSQEKQEGSYCSLIDFYKSRMSSSRWGSRGLSILIIVLGASLPLIALFDKKVINHRHWIAIIGAAIVIAQGFSQAFHYDETWRSMTVAKLRLEGAHRAWQTQIVDASLSVYGLTIVQKATDDFSDSVSVIVSNETTGFFNALSEPAQN